MTQWAASVGDILTAKTDALICSANPQLNLSGGVGGAFALQFGEGMQQFLRHWLKQSGQHFVQPGTIVIAPPCGSSYKAVIHAVAIDSLYDTSAEIIRTTYENSFAALSNSDCRTVAAACLACGYGRASPQTFIKAIQPLLSRSWPSIDRVEFISRDAETIEMVQSEILKTRHST